MEIFFEGITLRPWTISDAQQLALIADDKNISDNSRDGLPYPYSIKDARDWLNLILPENIPTRFFAVTIDNGVVGSIGIVAKTDIYRKNLEIGFFLSEKFRRQGIMTKAIRAVSSYAFGTFDIVRIYAEVFSDNTASGRALEKAGYRLEATLKNSIIKNDVIKDSCIYSVLREEFSSQVLGASY